MSRGFSNIPIIVTNKLLKNLYLAEIDFHVTLVSCIYLSYIHNIKYHVNISYLRFGCTNFNT